ncbi:Sucrase/ferredoxin-like-domain-containing protein [Lophiotrema nucula]|uniref:Altered inheritance of mitochondria protein 32 n=1 Tax=Lophiotrema nucula TaxID=690887 RepID=A0A6A5ZNH7_9PLEO|nr:Sucrase/ferredoxin-like-domain-containing protein [Lophiotrema nucula]
MALPCWRSPAALAIRHFTTSAYRARPSIPYIETCPSPTCSCATPPPDLDIDRKSPLLNTMAFYSSHVLVCTGKEDWSSRIEDDGGEGGDFIRGLKGIVGKGGEAFDPFNNIMATASSFPAATKPSTTDLLLFPSFKRINGLSNDRDTLSTFATAFLKAKRLHPFHNDLAPEQQKVLMRDDSVASSLPPTTPITTPTILICGHGGRDQRCGVMGPILRDEFRKQLEKKGIQGDVGLISHIGGHKYAGNAILYLPPTSSKAISQTPASSSTDVDVQETGLAGSGIWYGRVDPLHVEGIVEETIVSGRIIADLFRGGITKEGANLGRMLEEQMAKEKGEDGGLKLKPKARRP